MSAARDAILARIADALGDAAPVPVPRAYAGAGAVGGDPVARFVERVSDYRAEVIRVGAAELDAALAERCAARGSKRIVVAPGIGWTVPGTEHCIDRESLSARDLDGFDAALTGCALAIAETGTIVLDGGPQSGRRVLSLVPDHHLCVVGAEQIVHSVPDAIAALAATARSGAPLTFVSGPSATSDIELERVEGVHGPRMLDVMVVE